MRDAHLDAVGARRRTPATRLLETGAAVPGTPRVGPRSATTFIPSPGAPSKRIWRLLPCRMRLSQPRHSRNSNQNSQITVWCECQAKTGRQWRVVLDVADGLIDAETAIWPSPRSYKPGEPLGLVEADSRSASEARRIFDDHRKARNG